MANFAGIDIGVSLYDLIDKHPNIPNVKNQFFDDGISYRYLNR